MEDEGVGEDGAEKAGEGGFPAGGGAGEAEDGGGGHLGAGWRGGLREAELALNVNGNVLPGTSYDCHGGMFNRAVPAE